MGIFNGHLSPNQTIGGKGEKGDRGPGGLRGSRGLKGDQGDQGVQGPKGSQGSKGDQGDKGDKGDQGPRGVQGLGTRGDKGDKDDQGSRGVQGLKGDRGPKGDQGDQGPKGDQGPNSSYDNTIYRRSEIGNKLSVAITNLDTKPDGTPNIDTKSYYDLPLALKKQFYPRSTISRSVTTATTSSIATYATDIRSDEQCHFFIRIQGPLTKPFRFLYKDNHNTAIPQLFIYEGPNNYFVLQGSFNTGKIFSNPYVEIDQFTANAGTLYIDAQFTYTDDSLTSLSQPGFDVRLLGSSFDQSSRNIEANETEINTLKTRVNNISTTQRASQSEPTPISS